MSLFLIKKFNLYLKIFHKEIPVLDYFPSAAAAAAARSLQSCPTLCDPIDGSPPGSPVPGILQARTLEWVYFPSKFYQIFVEEIKPILNKIFH